MSKKTMFNWESIESVIRIICPKNLSKLMENEVPKT